MTNAGRQKMNRWPAISLIRDEMLQPPVNQFTPQHDHKHTCGRRWPDWVKRWTPTSWWGPQAQNLFQNRSGPVSSNFLNETSLFRKT